MKLSMAFHWDWGGRIRSWRICKTRVLCLHLSTLVLGCWSLIEVSESWGTLQSVPTWAKSIELCSTLSRTRKPDGWRQREPLKSLADRSIVKWKEGQKASRRTAYAACCRLSTVIRMPIRSQRIWRSVALSLRHSLESWKTFCKHKHHWMTQNETICFSSSCS